MIKNGPVRLFYDNEIFRFGEIQKVEFHEGKTDWSNLLILASMGKGTYGGADRVSNAPAMKIILNDKSHRHLYKFGNKDQFRETTVLINTLIEKFRK